MTDLFTPLRLRDLEIPNRVWMSPMCMYSAANSGPEVGAPTEFHLGHYGARAAGGVGLVMVEATAVRPEGRISAWDLGLWTDAQEAAMGRLAATIEANGAVPAIQLAHAGRKASTRQPWAGGGVLPNDEGGWDPVGPTGEPFPGLKQPNELTADEIGGLVQAWAESARRAIRAGFRVVEIHAAHGYLLHSFLSPLTNRRTDQYGGDLGGRSRFLLEVLAAVRDAVGPEVPVFIRISSTDWVTESDGTPAWTVEDSVELTRLATERGADLIDASSGGLVPVSIPTDVDYQTHHARTIAAQTGATVAAVGRITEPAAANDLVAGGSVDAVFLARALLTNPSWANLAAVELGATPRLLEQYAYTQGRR